MAAVTERTPSRGPAPDWARKYPPLITILVALALAIGVLPSSLNLPQTNPTQTLEYAPVPPDENEPPPPQGNLSALGLGSSSAIETGGAEGGNDLPLPPLPGRGKSPSTKRCVGNPPRQTEDPVAPPCVAHFQGDNFGNTYQGVTREEIRILIYLEGNIQHVGGSRGAEPRPEGEYFDLFEPEDQRGEHLIIRGLRAYQRYFNERFQTYDRVVHFYVYFGGADTTPEGKRADAADNFGKVRPFAVITSNVQGNEGDYIEAMAKKGVLNFGSFTGRSAEFFQSFPKLIWGYAPTIEYSATHFSDYVCTKVVNQPAVISGNPLDNGQPRKLGLWHTDDEAWPGLLKMAEMVKQKVEGCGGKWEAEGTFPVCCYGQDNATKPDYAATQMAEFKQQGITTIVWTGGIESHACKAAQGINYYPEWIILGDGTMDTNWPMQLSGNSACFNGHAITPTPEVLEPEQSSQRCAQALFAVDPTYPKPDVEYACDYYRNIFQLFTGIQVAGPRLGPSSIDKGFHAIPPVRHSDPSVPSCFYFKDDYTCVKDQQAEIWDSEARAPGDNRPGCWKAIEGGKRYLPGEWPKGNINAQLTGQEPCNARSVRVVYRPA